jgi:large subunit ribosomal protein L2
MGKRLIQQRRGRFNTKFNSPSHRFIGNVKYKKDVIGKKGKIEDIIHDSGRTAPIAKVRLDDNSLILTLASEGSRVGDTVKFIDDKKEINVGNMLSLDKIPEGTPIYNIEINPGDGGKLVRAGGSYASIVSHDRNSTTVELPSGQFKSLDSKCKATIGITAGGGRKDKPFLKAGKKHYAFRSRGKQYPIVRGVAMCAVSHPHGGGGHQHVGKPSTVKRGAPPGRKVGSIAAKRSGRK